MFGRIARWLTGSRSAKGAAPLRACVAVFGKHPAWQDFLELGVDSRPLADVKRHLHVGGVKPNLDRDDEGAWSRLAGKQRLDRFNHAFIWKMRRDVAVGRFWSSHDGSISRRPYPLFICAHLRHLDVDFAIEQVWPTLEWFEAAAQQAHDQDAVERALGQVRSRILELADEAPVNGEDADAIRNSLATIAAAEQWGDGRIGLLRILYEIDRDMADYRPGSGRVTGLATSWTLDRTARQVRVPRLVDSPARAGRLWLHALGAQLDPASPMLAIMPLQQPWVDLIVGMPDADQAFCILASDKALPLSSDVPYPLDSDFERKAADIIESWQSGTAQPLAGQQQQASEASGGDEAAHGRGQAGATGTRGEKGTLLWAIIGLGAIAIAAVALLVAGVLPPAITGAPSPASPPAASPPPAAAVPARTAPGSAGRLDRLSAAYRDWFARFEADLPRYRDLYSADPQLRRHLLMPLQDAAARGVRFDPRDVAAADDPQQAAADAIVVIEGVAAALRAERWDLVAGFERSAQRWAGRGWHRPASALNQAIERLRPGATGNLHQAIADAIELRPLQQAVDELAAGLDAELAVITALKAPTLGRFTSLVQQRTGSPPGEGTYGDIRRLQHRLEHVRNVSTPLAQWLQEHWPRVDTAALPEGGILELPDDGEITLQTFELWLARIEDYLQLDGDEDPRTTLTDAPRRLDQLNARLMELQQVDADAAAGLASRMEQLRHELDRLAALPAIRANLRPLQQDTRIWLRQADEIGDELGAALFAATTDRAQWLERTRQMQRIAASAAINQTWRQMRDTAVIDGTRFDQLTAEHLQRDAEAFSNWRQHLEALHAALTGIDDVPALDLPATAEEPIWPEALAGVWHQRWEAHLAAAIAEPAALPVRDDGVPDFAAARRDVERQLADVKAQFEQQAGNLLAMQRRLDALKLPEEAPEPDQLDMRQLLQRWQASSLAEDGAVTEAVEPILSRARQVMAAASETDREALARLARAPTTPLETAFNAWHRLGELDDPPWPADLPELEAEADIVATLRARLVRMQDEGLGRAALERIEAQRPERWLTAFQQAATATAIESLADQRTRFGIEALDQVPQPDARFNLLLLELRRGLDTLAIDDEAAARSHVTAMLQHARGMAPLPEAAGALLDRLQVALEDGDQPLSTLQRAGPAAPQVPRPLRWEVVAVEDDGDVIEMAWSPPHHRQTEHRMRFARIRPGNDGETVYLATTEMPIGLFTDIHETLDRWESLTALMDRHFGQWFASRGEAADPRRGPATWTLRRDRPGMIGSVMRPGDGFDDAWFLDRLSPGLRRRTLYAEDLDPALNPRAPRRDHPAQQVTAPWALYTAMKLNCRLPTIGEWQQAYQDAGSAAVPNLRDAAWNHQQEHLRRMRVYPREFAPDGGIFQPGRERGQPRTGREAEPGTGDDGILFFAPVAGDAASRFHHLVGNVAEFVLSDARWLEALTRDGAGLRPKVLAEAARQHVRTFHVIGGSALSPPRLPDGTPARPQQAHALGEDDLFQAFSDVGLRLAFPAPRRPLAGRLRTVLDEAFDGQRYLLPGQ